MAFLDQLSGNEDHLHIGVYKVTKFEVYGVKRSLVMCCTRDRQTDRPTSVKQYAPPSSNECIIIDLLLTYDRDFKYHLHKSKPYDITDILDDASRYIDVIFTIDNPEFKKLIPNTYIKQNLS